MKSSHSKARQPKLTFPANQQTVRIDDELANTRAALEPTLRAAADILPLVARPQGVRFPAEKAHRWQRACHEVGTAWGNRHTQEFNRLRPAIFALCASALDLDDHDCLSLAEALASATDQFDDASLATDVRLIAALSSACECLSEDKGLEHPLFPERVRYLVGRLQESQQRRAASGPLTATLLDIFVSEARERIETMYEGWGRLPPDTDAIKAAAAELAHLAESLDLGDIAHRAQRLSARLMLPMHEHFDLEAPVHRQGIENDLAALEGVIHALSV